MRKNINKREILDSFLVYLKSTILDLTEAIELIDPLTKSDYVDFRRLLDYLKDIENSLENSSNVRELNELVDLELLFSTWDESVLPYFNEARFVGDTHKFFEDIDTIAEEVNSIEDNY